MNITNNSRAGINPNVDYNQQKTAPPKPLPKSQKPILAHHDAILSISDQGKATLLAQEKDMLSSNNQSTMISEMLSQLNESSGKSEDSFDDKLKCLLIAMRIINGDHVPMKDRRFLAEKEPNMYSNALLLRKNNDKPKKYKSLLEGEEDNTNMNINGIGSASEEDISVESGVEVDVSADVEA